MARPGTFDYDDEGNAVNYNCSCHGNHNSVCEIVRQYMVNWNNGLHSEIRVRMGRRDHLLGQEVSIPTIATRDQIGVEV